MIPSLSGLVTAAIITSAAGSLARWETLDVPSRERAMSKVLVATAGLVLVSGVLTGNTRSGVEASIGVLGAGVVWQLAIR